ncbi:Monocarboxylate transporter 13 [Mizuhopecten yessoensis]|uniref:Monocarboxylate transporter 13 n=1 Tax=Mizuhopecten yessoensis TaxID=6573 RepID=A0A210QMS1_MIZYE|nr:Monocarboxylate transporter 13 [Mizuhopecten yessoensis]
MVPCFAVCKPRTVDVSGLNKSDTNASETISVSAISSVSALYSKKKDGTCSKLVTVCQNKVYVIYTLALVISVPTMTSISIFLINFLQFKGFDPQTAVFLYAVMTFFSAIFRLVPGFLKRIPHLSIMVIPVLFTIVGTITCAFIPFAITFEHHMILMGCKGISIGGTVTVISITTMKLVGMKNYSIGLGVTISGVGIGNSCGGPIAGYLRDTTGSYTLSFYVAAVGLGVASCLNIVAAAIRKYNANVSIRPEEYLKNRRGSRRRSSILPWKGKVEFIF